MRKSLCTSGQKFCTVLVNQLQCCVVNIINQCLYVGRVIKEDIFPTFARLHNCPSSLAPFIVTVYNLFTFALGTQTDLLSDVRRFVNVHTNWTFSGVPFDVEDTIFQDEISKTFYM